MNETPNESVRRALDILATGLRVHVLPDVERVFGDRLDSLRSRGTSSGRWDAQALLTLITDNWSLFKDRLGHLGRALVSELREDRNRWAHQGEFSPEDAYRTADSVCRLLRLVGAPGAPEAVEAQLLRASLMAVPPIPARVATQPSSVGHGTDRPDATHSVLSRNLRTWFTRHNGETAHGQPDSPLYVPGEPQDLPNGQFNYTRKALVEGFARIGWPATGDLRDPQWRAQAKRVYRNLIQLRYLKYLDYFASIRVGDIIAIPAYREKYDVHIGRVVPPRRPEQNRSPRRPDGSAYYYHHDIASGDWYECAHRVDVEWGRTADGGFEVVSLPELGGLWRMSFGPIRHGHERLLTLASMAGLLGQSQGRGSI